MKTRIKIAEDGSLPLSPIQQEKLKQSAGKLFVGDVEKHQRTLQQNSYYWVYLDIVAKETGNDAEDLHEYFRRHLLPVRIAHIKGKNGVYEVERLTSTTELDKLQFGVYLEQICASTGVPLPDPQEVGYYTP